MTHPAPYQGKRLSAKEVLRLYADGERNFRGAILRGCNFSRANLSGADFSKTDIKGANFSNTILNDVNFSQSKSGLLNNQIFYASLGSTTTLFLIGLFSYTLSHSSSILLQQANIRSLSIICTLVGGILILLFLPIFTDNYVETKRNQIRSMRLVKLSLGSLFFGFFLICLSSIFSFLDAKISSMLFFLTILCLVLALSASNSLRTFQ